MRAARSDRSASVATALGAGWSIGVGLLGFTSLTGNGQIVALVVAVLSLLVVAVGYALRWSWLATTYTVAALAAVGLITGGVLAGLATVGVMGVLGLIVCAATAPIAFQLHRMTGHAAPSGVSDTLQRIQDHVMLSDTAKRILFRERELELLRKALHEEIERANYDSAARLCDDLAETFGRREEAEDFRTQILVVRRERDEARILDALNQLDQHLEAADWGGAHQQAARLKRLYPDSHLIQDVDQRITWARNAVQQDLTQRFMTAADSGELETAMTLLKDLDRYMSRAEAESLSEVAGRVVTGWRDELSQRFKTAVNERRWNDALGFGERIVDEFPRSGIADEVRQVIDTIRVRSGGAVESVGD